MIDRPFNLLNYSIAFRKPQRLTDVDFWHFHIPFAFVIMAMLKPERFIELGTHKGDSYCAFCQAVDELGLNTACYAVDSWQGDDQTGFYSEAVYEELRAYHDPLYGGFSSLMKCLFDDGLGYFANGSIDLLHIDGHHSYESVRHDFEAWLPKMSKRGVILFHDTNVREREFGVWRFWLEVKDLYPSFDFLFGSGLGALAVGEDLDSEVRRFFEAGNRDSAALSNLFFNIGSNILLISEKERLLNELAHLQNTKSELEYLVNENEGHLKQAHELLKDLQSRSDALMGQAEAKERLLQEIFGSKGWKWLTRFREIKQKLVSLKNPGHEKQGKSDYSAYQAKTIHPVRKNRPKIIHAIGNVMTGGSTQLVIDLIEHLGHKYDQEVITNVIPSPVAYTGFAYHDFSDPAPAEDIENFIRAKGAKILHVHYWGEPWYLKVFEAAKNCPCSIIENINTPREPFIQEGIEDYVYVSNYSMNYASHDTGRAMVIYPGSNLTLFQRNGALIPDDVIGMVYRLEEDKLREDSIQVLIEVVKKRPSTTAYVIGGGTFLDSYIERVRAQGVADNFIFTGYVPYEQLPEYYRRFSLFVAPVWNESFGQVSTFAMGMKIPVVGYNVGALSEILGGTEFLGNDMAGLEDIIATLLDDRQKRIEIGEANYAKACEVFSVETMVDKYDRIYSRLLK